MASTDGYSYRDLVKLHFAQNNNRQLVDHQLSSMNYFMAVDLPQTILRSCPVRVTGSPDRTLTGTTRAAAGTAGTAIRVSVEAEDATGHTTKPGGPLLQASPAEPGTLCREVEVCVEFANVKIRKPTIFENNGSVTPMFPNDARLRNLNYVAPVYVDIVATFVMKTSGSTETVVKRRTLPNVQVGRIPVMVGSNYCILGDVPEKKPGEVGECSQDVGGYFILQGGERVIIAQERMAENMPFVFRNTRIRNKESEVIEVKSIGPDNEGAPKSMAVKLVMRPRSTGPRHIVVTCPRIKSEIPLFVLLRALGILPDKDILELVCGTTDTPYAMVMQSCMEEAAEVHTQDEAIAWLAANLGGGGGSRESYSANTLGTTRPSRVTTASEVLAEELLPHIGGADLAFEKAAFIAYMAKKVMDVHEGVTVHDDRDAYPNKKVELPGNLMGNLFRYHFSTKVIKDMKTSLTKEIHNGIWKTTGKLEDILNPNNVYKILKSSLVTIGMKSCLSTGNFAGGKMGTKIGISQVLSRMAYMSAISHIRRLSTPIEKTGKLLAPRKLHATQFGYVCPCETPEGHQVGVVKNLSSLATVTLPMSAAPVVAFLYDELGMRELPSAAAATGLCALHKGVRVFVNGAWIGMLELDAAPAFEAVAKLRAAKRCGRIHIHTGITFKPGRREIWMNTEGGRLIRPLLTAVGLRWIRANGQPAWETWDEVLRWTVPDTEPGASLIEYIDPSEAENAYIAMTPDDLDRDGDYTHVEIHPSTLLGTMASNIPLPDHNQAPRNAYQSSMGKQVVGTFATNMDDRMDTMAHLLCTPSLPIANTFMSQFYHAEAMPSGQMVIVAIMPYGGYNQEDSMMINRAFLDRGGFQSEFFRTYKDEEKKNQASGEEERFCRPSPDNTRMMKFANYAKLGADGFVPVNTFVTDADVLIGKVAPIRLRGTDGAAQAGISHSSLKAMSSVAAAQAVEAAGGKRYKCSSKLVRSNESGFVDRIYRGQNGEGFTFVKVRVREPRRPEIGDKFASRHGQKGTCGLVLEPEDMPRTASGVVPDILINPHAIPSRMTIAHLLETLLGRVGAEFACFGDATPFNKAMTVERLSALLMERGLEPQSNEILYCGYTGKQMVTSIFTGPIYYQRLKHMVADKIHCLTPDHDVLTMEGWKPITEVSTGDQVATLQEGALVYAPPIRTYTYPYDGPMIEVQDPRVGLKVTPNHKMWVQMTGEGGFGLHEAGTICGPATYQTDALWTVPDYSLDVPGLGRVNMDAWLTVVGFLVGGRAGFRYVGFSELPESPRVVECNIYADDVNLEHNCLKQIEFSSALMALGVSWSVVKQDNQRITSIVCTDPAILACAQSSDLDEVLEEWVWKLSRRQARQLLDHILIHQSVVTFGYTIAMDIQRLAVHAGVSLSFQLGPRPRQSGRFRSTDARPTVSDVRTVPYVGTVHCLEVPGNVFYVRRAGSLMGGVWTGNSRGTGPLVMLTRQPAEGRARDGGLRCGEMERDVLIGHGMTGFLKERFMEASDNFECYVCKGCGLIAIANRAKNIWRCSGCANTTDFSRIRIPYAYKLFLQELESMNVSSRIMPESRLRAIGDVVDAASSVKESVKASVRLGSLLHAIVQ